MAKTTVELTDRMVLQSYKETLGFKTDADFARWLGVSRQRLYGWMSDMKRVSDLWILTNLNHEAPIHRELAKRLAEIHAGKARWN